MAAWISDLRTFDGIKHICSGCGYEMFSDVEYGLRRQAEGKHFVDEYPECPKCKAKMVQKCAKCGKHTDYPKPVTHYKNRKTPMFICPDEKIPDIQKWWDDISEDTYRVPLCKECFEECIWIERGVERG